MELARAREGEKVAWVPVPKKTFWPPQGSASSVSTYRQESSTSLSGKLCTMQHSFRHFHNYVRVTIAFFIKHNREKKNIYGRVQYKIIVKGKFNKFVVN